MASADMSGHQYPGITASGWGSVHAGDRNEYHITICSDSHRDIKSSDLPCEHIDDMIHRLEQIEGISRALKLQLIKSKNAHRASNVHPKTFDNCVITSPCHTDNLETRSTSSVARTPSIATDRSSLVTHQDSFPVSETEDVVMADLTLPPLEQPPAAYPRHRKDPDPGPQRRRIKLDFVCTRRDTRLGFLYQIEAHAPILPTYEKWICTMSVPLVPKHNTDGSTWECIKRVSNPYKGWRILSNKANMYLEVWLRKGCTVVNSAESGTGGSVEVTGCVRSFATISDAILLEICWIPEQQSVTGSAVLSLER